LSTSIIWDVPNAKILLKHLAHHPMVKQKLQELALRSYKKKEEKVFSVLAAADIKDRYVRRLQFLHRWRVPIPIGLKVLPSTIS
jgi:hypothetical protein